MTKFNVKWGTSVKIITIFFLVVVVLSEISLLQTIIAYKNEWYFIVLFLVLLIGSLSIIYTPKYIILYDNSIVLTKIFGRKEIMFDDIINIQKFSSSGDIRVFGSGGYGGYLGIFSNAQIGKYSAYVGDFSQAFLIQLKNGKNYVFSCENRDLVIETIKKHL